MMGRTHVLLGINSIWLLMLVPGTVGTASSSSSHNVGLLAGTAALGALLPDLDAAQATIKFLRVGTHLKPFQVPAMLLHHAFGHRGLLHSLLGLASCALLLGLPMGLLMGGLPALALLLGYASHLAGDGCTKSGIPLWFPQAGRWHLLPLPLRLTTGSQAEELVFVLLAGGAFLLLLSRLFVQ